MRGTYGYPDIGRFGLGHSLLAWARCTVWCERMGAAMLGPIWLRPRFGPYLRGERDKREYFRLFSNTGYVTGLRRVVLLTTGRRILADDVGAYPRMTRRPTVVVFRNAYARNFETYFHEVAAYGPQLYAELLRITRRVFHPRAFTAVPFLAIHVRMGDFAPFDPVAVRAGMHNHRLPIEWYCTALRGLRTALGQPLRGIVFSDGTDAELAPLLAEPYVTRAPDGQSVTHMLEMAHASALIAGGSGFSFWSAFLGGVPRMVHPHQGLDKVRLSVPTVTWEESRCSLPTDFLDAIACRVYSPVESL